MRIYFFIIVFLFSLHSAVQGQVSTVQFGKNRVQYHDDFDQWSYYQSDNIKTYWYGKSRDIGYAAAKIAEKEYPEILDLLEHKMNHKIELLVFSELGDQNQSNIGDDEILYKENELVSIVNNKVFVYYTGDLVLLEKNIREGLCGILINDMFMGGKIEAGFQTNYAKKLPDWFLNGLISFAGGDWNQEVDDSFRQYLASKKGKLNFKKMQRVEPILTGHSFWYFLATTYGKSVIPNLLYLTKLNKDLDEAFNFVFGVKIDQMIVQWKNFFESIYEIENRETILPVDEEEWKLWKRGRAKITDGEYHPTLNQVAYVSNFEGRYRIFLRDLETKQKKKVFQYGTRNPFLPVDENYPSLRWSNNGNDLAIIYERRDKIYLRIINIASKEYFEQLLPERFERIFGFDFIDDRYLVMSGLTLGNIDLFRYDIKTRQSDQLMNDYYADMYPEVVEHKEGTFISFQSNRDRKSLTNWQTDSIPNITTSDIWMMDWDSPLNIFPVYQSKSEKIKLVKATDKAIFFSTDATGIQNLAMLPYQINREDSSYVYRFFNKYYEIDKEKKDSVDQGLLTGFPTYQVQTSNVSYLTDLNTHLSSAIVSPEKESLLYTLMYKEKYHSFDQTGIPQMASVDPVAYYQYLDRKMDAQTKRDSLRKAEYDPNQKFQSEYDNIFSLQFLDSLFRTKTEIFTNLSYDDKKILPVAKSDFIDIESSKVVPYRWQFNIFESSFDFNNELLFDGLDSYAGEAGSYERIPTGLLGKVVVKDLFEDYEFEGGVRFPPSFNAAEYYLIYRDLKHRLDKNVAFYRKVQSDRFPTDSGLQGGQKYEVLLGQYGLTYPLDFYNSVRAKFTLRQDKTIIKPTSVAELNTPPDVSQRLGLKLEYVFDNSFIYSTNIRFGTRAKLFAEAMKKVEIQFIEDFKFDFAEGYLAVLGFDIRHYLPVLKHSVFAVRGAGAVSLGPEKILYYLGGADNEIIPQFNDDGRTNYRYTYAFQTIAPSLRGFKSNVRSGNNHMMTNVELRIPIFQYIFGKNMRSRILKDFQVVGFFDAGMAWEGKDPYDPNNPINFVEIDRPPILSARIHYFRDPFVLGYGGGVRLNLFGYFVRGDYAWGVDSGATKKPMLHFSLGLDF